MEKTSVAAIFNRFYVVGTLQVEKRLMKRLMDIILLIPVCVFLVSNGVQATENIGFYLEDEPIYTSSSKQSPGFLLELVGEMNRITGIEPEMHFLPWKRAQRRTMNTPNAVIFPLTRTLSRESNYRWVCKVFDVPVMFISKEGSTVINSIEEAKKIRGIGVILGTPQEEYLKQQGVAYVSATGSELYANFAQGKYNFIYTAKPEALLGWKKGGHSGRLQFGQVLQTLPLWIATNKNSDLISDPIWLSALQQVKASGVFERLETKYFGQP